MDYIQQAFKGQREWWMILLTTVVVAGIFVLNFIVYLFSSPEDMEAAYDLMKQIPTNLSLIINLLPLAVLLALLFLLVKFVHQRSILSLTTARPKVDYKRIFFSFGLIFVLIMTHANLFWPLCPPPLFFTKVTQCLPVYVSCPYP